MLRQTRQTLLAAAPERFRLMYTDGPHHTHWTHHDPSRYMGESREEMYHQLLGANTPDEWDAIIGNQSWTHIWCDECKDYRDSGVTFSEGHDSVTICDDCLLEALKLAGRLQEAVLCEHGFGIGFCGDRQCPNHNEAAHV